MRYKAKIDLWFLMLLLIPLGIMGFMFVTMPEVWVELILLGVLNGLILWILVDSYVVLEDSFLQIRFGPISKRIHYTDIKSLRQTKNLWSSFALSVDRIEIKTKNRAFFTGVTYIAVRDNDSLFKTLQSLSVNAIKDCEGFGDGSC